MYSDSSLDIDCETEIQDCEEDCEENGPGRILPDEQPNNKSQISYYKPDEPIKEFYKALDNNDLRLARKLIRENDELQKLNPKKLNQQYKFDNYKFTSRGGILTIYNTNSDKERISFAQEQQKINDIYEQFKMSQQQINSVLINKYNDLDTKIKSFETYCHKLTAKINQLTATVNECVQVINQLNS